MLSLKLCLKFRTGQFEGLLLAEGPVHAVFLHFQEFVQAQLFLSYAFQVVLVDSSSQYKTL
ncbi:hypothetical protein AKJ52_00205 [candidate division MSBL1 archaeon SCGC-AAA382C18]|uniref:Uncharacterized protein n=1 Tax=candidate division MSBL1 archaeon SCGC-AAA382C18 TaxID=1698281 RepID=A0A133VM81_9EURY|nr:hypothetical protein AKJ52_00205 [candidate division MSBL1 archaeon SCGC-AAA382C18]